MNHTPLQGIEELRGVQNQEEMNDMRMKMQQQMVGGHHTLAHSLTLTLPRFVPLTHFLNTLHIVRTPY